MRSLLGNKRLVLLLAILALGALTILAVSLNGIPFREAQHFASQEAENVQPPAQPLPKIYIEIPLWKQLVVIALLVLLVVLVILLLSPKWRKRVLLLFIRALIWTAAIYFVLRSPIVAGLISDILKGLKPLTGQRLQQGDDAVAPMPAFEPPQVSPTFSYLISFAFALIFLVVVWMLFRGWQRYMLLTAKKPLDEIARIARSSLDDLSSGRNSSDVIINCYLRMSDVVAEKRRLRRAEAMTPQEFALHLERAGLPGEAVAGLTRLFEGVRYGDRKSGPKDVNEAVRCLKTILNYCGEPV